MTRILHPRKLTGADIRFIRKAICVEQKDMAQKIETSPEHLSRCEAGTLVMSPTTEKLLRVFAFKTAVKLHKMKSCEAKTKLEDALDELFDVIKTVPAHDINDILELHFHRCRPSPSESGDDEFDIDNGEWDKNRASRSCLTLSSSIDVRPARQQWYAGRNVCWTGSGDGCSPIQGSFRGLNLLPRSIPHNLFIKGYATWFPVAVSSRIQFLSL